MAAGSVFLCGLMKYENARLLPGALMSTVPSAPVTVMPAEKIWFVMSA